MLRQSSLSVRTESPSIRHSSATGPSFGIASPDTVFLLRESTTKQQKHVLIFGISRAVQNVDTIWLESSLKHCSSDQTVVLIKSRRNIPV
ncbi:hypothetical protein T265_11425 [Opisthorchis viverrini]|uniref:Uncharacterized protein n=1 Tax=Opisthorchis viverrini TaxID=6198 RepID=A0A074ZXI4_OPIVI|nr:hypothetical protein T265_11425 [Opisthorchis viverrini]KER19914.1 hypothetical protein T265_11425 [Opisthorchis viverrini]